MTEESTAGGTGTGEQATGTGAEPGRGRNWSVGNWIAILGFLALTLVGLSVATGGLFCESSSGVFCGVTSPDSELGAVQIPPYVVLYSTLGALGYAFTKFVTQLERYDDWADFERVASVALRVPAAWLLAAGVYLLFGLLVGGGPVGNAGVEASSPPPNPRLGAGVSFLVGLYVNVTYKSLGSLADKLLS